MRKIIVAGNWKMNMDWPGAEELFKTIQEGISTSQKLEAVYVFPPYPYLTLLNEIKSKSFIFIGSQNVSSENSGAFTGEVSASMLKSIGINHALIGHSERRSIFGESKEVIKEKVDRAIENDLNVIFCCGESLDERESMKQESIIEEQLEASLLHLNPEQFKNVTIAYEPVWAIGTGLTASSEQAEEMHSFIRRLLRKKYNDQLANNTHILYGGSCNGKNAKELFNCENVDGGLIGGASLKAEEFLKIISIVNE